MFHFSLAFWSTVENKVPTEIKIHFNGLLKVYETEFGSMMEMFLTIVH